MDNQDHRRRHTPGHDSHGVHVCHKCGWPFPNPHPSAKHRRAHKNICGTIKGYKLVDSESSAHLTVSDDEHLSDEDRKTGGPRILGRSNNEKGSVETGDRSGRPENEVFSDSGFRRGIEESPDDVNKPAKNETTATLSVKDGAIAAAIPPSSNSANSSQMQNTEVEGSNLSVSAQQSQDNVSSATASFMDRSSTDYRTEESVYEPTNDEKGSTCDSNTIQLGTQADTSWEMNEKTAGEDLAENVAKGNEETQTKTNSAVDGLTEIDTNTNEETSLGGPLLDAVVLPCDNVGEASESVGKMEDIMSGPVSAAGVIQLKEQSNDELDSKISLNDLPNEIKSVELVNTSIGTAQVKADDDQAMDAANLGKSTNFYNGHVEGNDNVHVLSVPDDIPVTDNAEVMIRGFKDHKGGGLLQLVGVDFKDDSSNFCSSILNEGTEVSASDMHALKSDHEQKCESDEHIVENFPDETEPVMPQVKMTGNESQSTEQIGVPTAAVAIAIEKNGPLQCPEEQLPSDCSESSLQKSSVEHATKVLPDMNPVAAQVISEVMQTTNLVGADDADDYENSKIRRCDIAENEDKRITDKNSTENIIANETVTEEGYSTLGSMEGKVSVETPVSTTESGENLQESNFTSENVINASKSNLSEYECMQLSRVSDHQKCVKELESDGNRKVQVEGGDKVSAAAESINVEDSDELQKSADNVGDVELLQGPSDIINDVVLQKSSEDGTKEPQLSPLDISSSIQNSATAGDNSAGDFVGVVSENQLESSPDKGESKSVAQQLCASVTDFSVDSGSRTDSLEGHWGSVSVLSTQSDMPAIVDAEASNGSKASVEAEKADLTKPKAFSEGQHSDKSDIFEPPSFMTLVEPRDGDKAAAAASSEIQTTQNPNQPAGWFPSLTHVTNESQGRKKNEEIIAKVTNWSAGKQHTPLKNLLSEANIETKSKSLNNAKENLVVKKDESSSKDNGASGPQVPISEAVKKEAGKEWNSPARYPTDIKGEKKKVKGRPSWAQFMCCASVN